MVLGSIDIGSNTVRLLVAEVKDGRIAREMVNSREITRLAEGLKEGEELNPAARARTLSTVMRFAAQARDAGAEDMSAVATEALRKAVDAAVFVEEVKEETGLEIEIISGEEEARRTLIGIHAGVAGQNLGGRKLLIDIGGGSTEFILTEDWHTYKSLSLPLGAVGLYERFLFSDPPAEIELKELRAHCLERLSVLPRFIPRDGPPLLVGTAGTVTTLAAVEMAMDVYDPAKITGHRMGREVVARLLRRFTGLTRENRKLVAGLEPGREDVIISGTMLLGTIMDLVKSDSVAVCDFGLREGNLLNFWSKKRRG